jgi:hypothetical protein
MKLYSPLITTVRRIFSFGRGLIVFCAALIPFIIFFPPLKTPMDLGEVFVQSPALVVKNTSDGVVRAGELQNLRGHLVLKIETPEERKMNSLIRSVTLSITFGLAFLVCHWIRQLCLNVEAGEIFTAGNLRLVRRLGWLLIAQAVLGFGAQVWAANRLAAYVSDHLSLSGLEVIKPQSVHLLFGGVNSSVSFDITQIIVGLLVLCLTEVFRKGMTLKQEADLTV